MQYEQEYSALESGGNSFKTDYQLRSEIFDGPLDSTIYSQVLNEYKALCNPLLLKERLRSIRQDKEALRQIASRSYRHQDDFDKVVLKFYGRQYPSIRLHVWAPQKVSKSPDIHNHSWEFRSLILCGSLKDDTYEKSSTDKTNKNLSFHEYEHLTNSKPFTEYQVTYLGPTTLTLISTHHLMTGSSYGFDSSVIHRTTPDHTSFCVTIFLQFPFIKQRSLVFCSERTKTLGTAKVPTFSPNQLYERLQIWDEEIF